MLLYKWLYIRRKFKKQKIMKLTKLIFLFAITLATVSCNKDDDNNSYDYNKSNLTGTYSLTYFKSKEVKTEQVSGFEVTTTTTSTGDTFEITYDFASNNTVTLDGTYRIVDVIKQGDQTTDDAHTEVRNSETSGYAVSQSTKELTIDGSTYKVRDFSPTGFKITLSETNTESNGDNIVYTEELRFTK